MFVSKFLYLNKIFLFLSTLGLGSTPFVLYINPFCTYVPCKIWRSFVSLSFLNSPLAGFIFFFLFLVAQLHACVVCIALPASLAMVPTQGFYFAFAAFLLFLENKYALARRG